MFVMHAATTGWASFAGLHAVLYNSYLLPGSPYGQMCCACFWLALVRRNVRRNSHVVGVPNNTCVKRCACACVDTCANVYNVCVCGYVRFCGSVVSGWFAEGCTVGSVLACASQGLDACPLSPATRRHSPVFAMRIAQRREKG